MIRRGRVLAIFAHPDDESLLAGGTLAACAAAGVEVTVLCLTRGEQGPISDPSIANRQTLGKVREAELHEAACTLGVSAVECLSYPDGGLPWADKTKIIACLSQKFASYEPDAIITFGPEGLYWHPDHIAVHEFTIEAFKLHNSKLITMPPNEEKHQSSRLYYATWPEGMARQLVANMAKRGLHADLWGLDACDFGAKVSSITTCLDIKPFLDCKLRALRSHRSQLTEDHLFRTIPDDLAAQYLGYEYFTLALPSDHENDWLAAIG